MNLCVILARGGSKGLPGKNIKDFAGKPLIAHSINTAQGSGLFEHVLVSSDNAQILDVAKHYKADVIRRPDDLATDSATSIDALIHALEAAERTFNEAYDNICLLQPTSPLVTAADVEGAYKVFTASGASSVFSVFKPHASPYFNMVEVTNGQVAISKQLPDNITRRQDAPEVYQLNGAIYFWKKEPLLAERKLMFKDSAIYEMPFERSADIDTQADFEMAEFIYKKLNG